MKYYPLSFYYLDYFILLLSFGELDFTAIPNEARPSFVIIQVDNVSTFYQAGLLV